MKTILFLALSSLFIIGSPGIDKEEALKAYTYLNSIRSNPASYKATMPFLKKIKTRTLLKWNDTLAKVAEKKALDMATRLYFKHVDPEGYGMNYFIDKAGYNLDAQWINSRELNFFESISAGSTSGEDAIYKLLLDAKTPSLGHRKHLLGLDDWNASLADIGIGYARPQGSAPYESYVCVLIAKHY